MADMVKKSRIVSDPDENLEESLLEEFNMRLKNCMGQDEPQPQQQQQETDEGIYENVEVIERNGKICDDFIQTERENHYDVPAAVKINGHCVETNFIEAEAEEENHYETVGENEKETDASETNIDCGDQCEESQGNDDYESVEPGLNIPDVTFNPSGETTNETDLLENKSVKDRMFLSTDDTSCLLFTQTVTSPMLTPSEENIDFLKGFCDGPTPNSSPENSDAANKEPENPVESTESELEAVADNIPSQNDTPEQIEEEHIPNPPADENSHEDCPVTEEDPAVLNDTSNTPEIIYENLKDSTKNFSCDELNVDHLCSSVVTNDDEVDFDLLPLEISPSQLVETIKSQLLKSPDSSREKKDSKDVGELRELKAVDITKQINKFETTTTINNCVGDVDVSSQIESSYVETSTIVETKTAGQEKTSLKKKKSKKSRSHEKENISVSQTIINNSNGGESYYNVNVKSLCRSFGDLTKIGVEKCDGEKIQTKAKSSFSKFDALQKKNVLHVRSSDSAKAQEKFNGSSVENSNCKSCSKPVFQMEQIKAERAMWHKNCFRCHECNKQLNVDTYQSNEGTLYCKPHFKALFTPKAVEDDTPITPKKHELIIRENQPMELPPDVIRASDKPSLGLEELQSLNVKERFQVFEHHQDNEANQLERTSSAVNVKRSPSILSKLARFQAKGMDIGIADDALNGIPIQESSSEEDEDEDEQEAIEGEDADLIRAKRAQKEKPFHFVGMSDVKSKWEQGNQQQKDDRREERKQEIQTIRNRLFMGKQGKMKEAYQQAVLESETGANVKKATPVEACDTRSLKERFEKGEVFSEESKQEKEQDDLAVFESAISKKSRSIFLELDANASKAPQISTLAHSKSMEVKKIREASLQHQISSEDVVKSSQQVDDVTVQTADIQQRFKFFETYKEPEKKRKEFRITPPREGQVKSKSPDREIYRDPDVIRAEEYVEDSVIAKEQHTATKMLSMFRQMEENQSKEQLPAGPKPLKRFTPPPEPTRQESSSSGGECSSEEDEVDGENGVQDGAGNKIQDEDLLEAQKAARAKQLRAKFERWEAEEIRREQSAVNIAEEIGEESQIESTKSLRARFESMRENKNDSSRSPRVKVNRFVFPQEFQPALEVCESCGNRVYPLEKISVHGHVYHKGCFKCLQCSAVLRMDSYSYNQGLLYCMPHFKRLFISKGNYDSAFGLDQQQHKEKWNTTVA